MSWTFPKLVSRSAPVILLILTLAAAIAFAAVSHLVSRFTADQQARGRTLYAQGLADAGASRYDDAIAAFRAAGAAAGSSAGGSKLRFALLLYVRRDGDATRLRARMFAPLGGVLEDPATGSACAALAALLTSMAVGANVDLHYEIEQGVEMGRPSLLIASGRKTQEGPVEATVAGSCVPAARGMLEV